MIERDYCKLCGQVMYPPLLEEYNQKLIQVLERLLEVLEPCLRITGRGADKKYPTLYGSKTRTGLKETIKTILEEGGKC